MVHVPLRHACHISFVFPLGGGGRDRRFGYVPHGSEDAVSSRQSLFKGMEVGSGLSLM